MTSLTPTRAEPRVTTPVLPPVLTPLRRWLSGLAARRTAARVARVQARVARAAREACAIEGATTEFEVVEFDGRRFGAVYVGGRLNCLLPQVERL